MTRLYVVKAGVFYLTRSGLTAYVMVDGQRRATRFGSLATAQAASDASAVRCRPWDVVVARLRRKATGWIVRTRAGDLSPDALPYIDDMPHWGACASITPHVFRGTDGRRRAFGIADLCNGYVVRVVRKRRTTGSTRETGK